ncbi:hypothetical protein, partial [Mycoplana sp. MJR14]|uniref:hypothetical protein n=1 Tax=Mycoplana sp. MJR14 TaxID=3032583 RepID=UPI0023DC211B
MNAVTLKIPDDVHRKVNEIAAERGLRPEDLLADMAERMVREYDAHQAFMEMADQGKSDVDAAVKLLNRP